MRRAAIVLGAALMLCAPGFAHAQYSGMDKQNPNEYNDDDSQPLKLISYVIAPIGFVLEWGVARPLHYLATDTFLAPVLGANTDADKMKVAPIAELPPPDEISDTTEHHDVTIVPNQPESPASPTAQSSASAVSAPSHQPELR
ncbi:MAG TPA: hypothetical protein VNF27_08780 [Candidatus Binataceae bacterium]|nr:hypothetical protein [Candidatus Binataceae bacterium]